MSYWYERFAKSHVLWMIACVPVVLVNTGAQVSLSYASGCLATASRTLWDWISVDASYNSFEIFPYVHSAIETGCIEWLGFSTCEAVQFRNWMDVWTPTETLSVHIFNTTNAGTATQYSQVQVTKLPSFDVQREWLDDGISVSPGEVLRKRRMQFTSQFDASRLQENIVTMHPNAAGITASSYSTAKAGDLLGFFNGGAGAYFDINTRARRHENFIVPSPTNKVLKEKSLYYFSSYSSDERKCTFDNDCGNSCVMTSSCQPMAYGFEGTILPSATFFFQFKTAILELNHWPLKPWDYSYFCPFSDADGLCRKVSRKILVFNPDSFSLSFYDNKGDAPSEKYPDLEMNMWKYDSAFRRTEGCDGYVNLGTLGKDCGIPSEYTFYGRGLFLSSPKGSQGEALHSEIYVERTTGLRFDYRDVWQLNRQITSDYYHPLLWVDRKSEANKIDDTTMQFSAFKTYGSDIVIYVLIGYMILNTCTALLLIMGLKGMTCMAFCDMMNKEYEPNAPQYI